MSIEAEATAFGDNDKAGRSRSSMTRRPHGRLGSHLLEVHRRTSLLTAEQEVDLAKRIEAGLFAEHKLDSMGLEGTAGLDENLSA